MSTIAKITLLLERANLGNMDAGAIQQYYKDHKTGVYHSRLRKSLASAMNNQTKNAEKISKLQGLLSQAGSNNSETPQQNDNVSSTPKQSQTPKQGLIGRMGNAIGKFTQKVADFHKKNQQVKQHMANGLSQSDAIKKANEPIQHEPNNNMSNQKIEQTYKEDGLNKEQQKERLQFKEQQAKSKGNTEQVIKISRFKKWLGGKTEAEKMTDKTSKNAYKQEMYDKENDDRENKENQKREEQYYRDRKKSEGRKKKVDPKAENIDKLHHNRDALKKQFGYNFGGRKV